MSVLNAGTRRETRLYLKNAHVMLEVVALNLNVITEGIPLTPVPTPS